MPLSRALAGLLLVAAAPPVNGRVFDAAWKAVERDYWDARFHGVDWAAMRDRYRPRALAARDDAQLYATINAMLATLDDSHLFAIPPAEVRYEAARDAGAAQAGFGLAAYREDDRWLVYAVTPGSAAFAAGVRPGWELVSIDRAAIDIDSHPQAGQRSRLLLRDEAGRPHPLDLVAALDPPEPAVRATRLPGDVLLIAVDGFGRGVAHDVSAALRTRHPRAVILDLRENDGGEEEVAARTAGLFFAHRRTLLRRIDRKREQAVPIAGAGTGSFAGPLAVLVGARSASAAEAVAALLGESGRAETVGQRTAGALTGAAIERLPGGGRLSVALFDVRTPGGRRIEGTGFTPAHVVPETRADMAAGRDPALAEAVRLVGG